MDTKGSWPQARDGRAYFWEGEAPAEHSNPLAGVGVGRPTYKFLGSRVRFCGSSLALPEQVL